ncbi:MAG: DNA mismatch repair endonuclease MutL [Syntrophomonas sp.]|nr:DNA mismatch repair endonuclease MutL [Syntrophomonas sp.]
MQIKLLDDRLVNKIAAGEVVERPASIVKELVENAIDAGSSRISVLIAGGGIDRIEVVDNGYGIPAHDVLLAFERHATSKIQAEADLNSIHTMGFRGEALPSIASVSRIEILSQCESGAGIRVCLDGGKLKAKEYYPTAAGTKIIVRDVFYNTPARKKFLKSPVSEGIHIHEVIIRLALSRPDISFTFANEKKLYFKTPGNGSIRDVMISIYGHDYVSNFIDIEWQGENYAIRGLISKPEWRRTNRKNQLFYVNNRFIKSPMLAKAVDEGYRGRLLSREYPAVVLFLTVDSNEVDVNVHPQKTEIRFRDEKMIFNLVNRGLKVRLEQFSITGSTEVSDLDSSFNFMEDRGYTSFRNGSKYIDTRRDVSGLPDGGQPRWYPEARINEPGDENYIAAPTCKINDQTLAFNESSAASATFKSSDGIAAQMAFDNSEYAVIGQCFNSYILCEKDEDLWIVDQHAAHERINYNRLLDNRTKGCESQLLAFPIAFDLSSAEMDSLELKMKNLQEYGFQIEALGDNTVVIRSAPTFLRGQEIDIIKELLEISEELHPDELKKEILARIACKQSVKAGQSLTRQEMATIINALIQTADFHNCPHGRPTIIKLNHQELDKRFKRK